MIGLGTDQANATYRELVARVRGGDFAVDFRTLRMACARSNICEPRAKPDDLAAMNVAVAEPRLNDAADICEKLVNQGFINIEAHMVCGQTYSQLNKAEQSKFHMDVMTALLRSILDAGDGKTEATAYEVISVREEYIVLAAMGLPNFGNAGASRRTVAEGGHQYERWEVRNPKTQADVVVFFNIDAVPPTK